MIKVYAAGPDVFRSNPDSHFNKMANIAKNYGVEIITPVWVDNHKNTFKSNIECIDKSDVVMANLCSFRGASIDDGTAMEIGYAFAKNKRIYGYTQLRHLELKQKSAMYFNVKSEIEFPIVEDCGLSHNLMIYNSIYQSLGEICETYEDCLRLIKY